MNATTTAMGTIGAAGGAVLSVDSLASVLHWLAVHYSVSPIPDDIESKAAAVLFLATVGSVVGGIWWVIRAIIRRWLVDHNIIENGGDNGQVVNP